MILKKSMLFLLVCLSQFCSAQIREIKPFFHYSGRVEKMQDNKVILIGSASSVSFNFEGESCSISLQSVDFWEHQNYVSLELDGTYIGRIRIEKGEMKAIPIAVPKGKKTHHLSIYKATEAANGVVLFVGTTAKLIEISTPEKRKKIEFIGDSITCGMGNDTAKIPCGTGDWFDQHNAYLAFGPVASRALNADFVLSSVSGIGMYRNWNDEHKDEEIMSDVYENLYLNNSTNKKPYGFSFQPDLVSICLGTNDISDGDGKKERLPFNEEKYVNNYISFIKTIYTHAPNTRIVLLNSPMVSGDRNLTLVRCLKKVIKAFESDVAHNPIAFLELQAMSPKGCSFHPDITDDKLIADQLIPFYKKLLDEK